jgi:hypothetical protein
MPVKYYYDNQGEHIMDISGFLPSILYNDIPHEKYGNLYAKGNDVDITISNGSSTYISGITLGNGSWEIDELDDGLNLFPEYSEGDVISRDVLLKVLMSASSLSQSRHIFSFNALGKVKYGIQDKTSGIRDKVTKAKQWLTDEITPEIAQDFLQKSYPGARIGKIDKYSSKDGGVYKVMFGVPSEKKYYVMCLQRNGNKIRELDDDDYEETPIYSFTDGDVALKCYNQYPSEEGLENAQEDNEITLEEIQGAMGNDSDLSSYNVIDFENIENKDFLLNGRPTAIAFIAGTLNDRIMVGVRQFWRTEDGSIKMGDGQTKEVKSENDVANVVGWAIDLYKQYGGTKDLSYLLKKNDFEEEEIPTSGEDNGVQWEIKQSAKKKRKKSEFWGKNVTGYEDGMLGEMAT